jgi:hypothetical protein
VQPLVVLPRFLSKDNKPSTAHKNAILCLLAFRIALELGFEEGEAAQPL